MKSRRVCATAWILYHGRRVFALALTLWVVCGSAEVFIVDPSNGNRVTWRWTAADREELPVKMRPLFKYTAECKPVNSGNHILIASSSDGVALVARATGQVEAYASVPNAHSAELLPDGRIVVVSSSRGVAGGRLAVFERGMPMKARHRLPLPAGHGVVWDADRATLWALSGSSVRAYAIRDWTMEGEWRLPEAGGHDLYPVPGSAALSVTTNTRCWLFDRDTKQFTPHPVLADSAKVKSIAQAPDGRIAWVQADPGGWWGTLVRFLNPDGAVEAGGMRLYKARWLTPGEPRLPSIPSLPRLFSTTHEP